MNIWRLRDPLATGDLDEGRSYDRIELDRVVIDFRRGTVTASGSYGTVESGAFRRGTAKTPLNGELYLADVEPGVQNAITGLLRAVRVSLQQEGKVEPATDETGT